MHFGVKKVRYTNDCLLERSIGVFGRFDTFLDTLFGPFLGVQAKTRPELELAGKKASQKEAQKLVPVCTASMHKTT